MASLLSVVLLLAGLLIPQQPTSKLTVIVLYTDYYGPVRDSGVGPGWPIEVSQQGKLISKAVTDENSSYTFELPTGLYFIQVKFDGGIPIVDYRCQTFYILKGDKAIIIRCIGLSWIPFLAD